MYLSGLGQEPDVAPVQAPAGSSTDWLGIVKDVVRAAPQIYRDVRAAGAPTPTATAEPQVYRYQYPAQRYSSQVPYYQAPSGPSPQTMLLLGGGVLAAGLLFMLLRR